MLSLAPVGSLFAAPLPSALRRRKLQGEARDKTYHIVENGPVLVPADRRAGRIFRDQGPAPGFGRRIRLWPESSRRLPSAHRGVGAVL